MPLSMFISAASSSRPERMPFVPASTLRVQDESVISPRLSSPVFGAERERLPPERVTASFEEMPCLYVPFTVRLPPPFTARGDLANIAPSILSSAGRELPSERELTVPSARVSITRAASFTYSAAE